MQNIGDLMTKYEGKIAKILELKPADVQIKLAHYDKAVAGDPQWETVNKNGDFLCTETSSSNAGWHIGRFMVFAAKNVISSFDLSELPHCCGILVSHGAHVYYPHQNKGIGTLLQKFRIDLAKRLGYTIMLCTDVKSNKYQRKILEKHGWKDVLEFQNSRSGNTVAVSCLNVGGK